MSSSSFRLPAQRYPHHPLVAGGTVPLATLERRDVPGLGVTRNEGCPVRVRASALANAPHMRGFVVLRRHRPLARRNTEGTTFSRASRISTSAGRRSPSDSSAIPCRYVSSVMEGACPSHCATSMTLRPSCSQTPAAGMAEVVRADARTESARRTPAPQERTSGCDSCASRRSSTASHPVEGRPGARSVRGPDNRHAMRSARAGAFR